MLLVIRRNDTVIPCFGHNFEAMVGLVTSILNQFSGCPMETKFFLESFERVNGG
jgi:hypothetical protein